MGNQKRDGRWAEVKDGKKGPTHDPKDGGESKKEN